MNVLLNTALIKDVFHGCCLGYSGGACFEADVSARKGTNYVHTALSQISAIENLKKSFHYLSKRCGLQVMSLKYFVVIPIVVNLSAFLVKVEKFPRLKKTLHVANATLVPLCHLGLLVSSVALIVFGEVYLGASSCVFMSMYGVRKCEWMPSVVTNNIRDFGSYITIISMFLFPSVPTVLFGSIELVMRTHKIIQFVFSIFSQWIKHIFSRPRIFEIPLEKASTISLNDVAINWDHMHRTTHPFILSDITGSIEDYDSLRKKFKHIVAQLLEGENKEKFQKIFDNEIAQDKTCSETNPDPRKHIETGIDLLFQKIQSKHFSKLAAAQRDKILLKLQQLPDEEQFSHIIILALGAHYCDIGVVNTINIVYQTLFSFYEGSALEDTILRILMQRRRALFEQYMPLYPMSGIQQRNDLHNHSEALLMAGPVFGLRNDVEEVERLEDVIEVSRVGQYIFRLIAGRAIKKNHLLPYYKIKDIIDMMQDAYKENTLKHALISEWFINEYREQHPIDESVDDVEKGKLYEKQRTDAKRWVRDNVFKEEFNDDDIYYSIYEEYFIYFLIKQGIFQYAPRKSLS